jgi:hypothetical protein
VLAKHSTEQEDAANKVERQVGTFAAAMLLESRIGEQFAALVTGASDKGTWARLLTIPVEGRVVRRFEGGDVGDQIRVHLSGLQNSPALNDVEQHDDDGDHHQDVNESAHRVTAHQPQQPEHDQYDGDRVQHDDSPSNSAGYARWFAPTQAGGAPASR